MFREQSYTEYSRPIRPQLALVGTNQAITNLTESDNYN